MAAGYVPPEIRGLVLPLKRKCLDENVYSIEKEISGLVFVKYSFLCDFFLYEVYKKKFYQKASYE